MFEEIDSKCDEHKLNDKDYRNDMIRLDHRDLSLGLLSSVV